MIRATLRVGLFAGGLVVSALLATGCTTDAQVLDAGRCRARDWRSDHGGACLAAEERYRAAALVVWLAQPLVAYANSRGR